MTRQAKVTDNLRDRLAVKGFAMRLCNLLIEHQISQADFARETGISQSKLSRYMRGKNEPKLADLAAMCVVLNVSPEAFLDSTAALRPLTPASEAAASFDPVEHKFLRDLFQILRTKLLRLKPEERHRYLEQWVRFAETVTDCHATRSE